jgi:hypothetical protein
LKLQGVMVISALCALQILSILLREQGPLPSQKLKAQ